MKTVLILLFGLCATEDSSNCVWDAQAQGNKEGISFLYLSTETESFEALWLIPN